MSRRVTPYGDTGLLVEVPDLAAALALGAALRTSPPPGVIDVIPAARSVLLRLDPTRTDVTAVTRAVALVAPAPAAATSEQVVEIPVVYDGLDLEEVGRLTGLGASGVVTAHGARPWVVGFSGFTPGFGYCTDGDPRLHVPRRDDPRTRVPTGSVALAGEFTGVYPRDSPGGWQLIGRTDAVMWDVDRDPPAVLRPGVRVRFTAVDQLGAPPAAPTGPAPNRAVQHPAARGLEVISPGLLSTVQDLGRAGRSDLGLGTSGACDRSALQRANRLVGNPEGSAGLEVTLGGLRVRARGRLVLAVTGAPSALDLDGAPVPMDTPFRLEAGAVLSVGTPVAGARTYLAVHGGLDVAPVLGSRSTDLLAGVGPAPVEVGEVLQVGADAQGWAPVDVAPGPPTGGAEVRLRVLLGPHEDWFTAASRRAFLGGTYAVSASSNRVGVRLTGAPLERRSGGEIPSEGLLPGAIQVPPSGLPTLLLADHPATGGYPVIAVVCDADLDAAGQLRPGQQVSFRPAARGLGARARG